MGGFGFMQHAISSLNENRAMMKSKHDKIKDRYHGMMNQKALIPSKSDLPSRSEKELAMLRKELNDKIFKENLSVTIKTIITLLIILTLLYFLWY